MNDSILIVLFWIIFHGITGRNVEVVRIYKKATWYRLMVFHASNRTQLTFTMGALFEAIALFYIYAKYAVVVVNNSVEG